MQTLRVLAAASLSLMFIVELIRYTKRLRRRQQAAPVKRDNNLVRDVQLLIHNQEDILARLDDMIRGNDLKAPWCRYNIYVKWELKQVTLNR